MNQEETDLPEDEEQQPTNDFKNKSINGKSIVAKMQLNFFRECLINHFDIRYKMKTINMD